MVHQQGIGKATAKHFSANGWNVIATMRTPEKEQELSLLDNVLVTKLDVRDEQTIKNAIAEGLQKFGKIDLVVNNAGYGQYGIFESVTPEQIRAQFETNVFGVMNVMRAIVPYYRSQNEGMIINISSAGGRITLPLISTYMSSKFALEGFSESVSYELASQNIILKLVEPGGVDTPFHITSGEKFALNPELKSYNEFSENVTKSISRLAEGVTSAHAVAEVVFGAATDDTDTLRYQSGEDSKAWIKARTSMADGEYMNHMKNNVFQLK
nr:SDR family oxidoreductase [Flavobacterium psychroterrae]